MRHKSLFAVVLLSIGLLAPLARAVPIVVENWSFELPGSAKQTNFENVPGWSTDTVPADSGVETGYTPTDGQWTAYLRGGATDPSIWQLTEHVIAGGDVFELKVDCRITYIATTLRMVLYYDAKDGSRAVGATADYTITSSMAEYSLTFDSTTVPACAGRRIGIEFRNTTGDGTWLGLDRVRLELVKAGSTGGAVAPSPADEATDVLRDVVLSWTPGTWANTHNVYFGTSRADVNAASVDNPNGVLLIQGADANSFDVGRLEFDQTYYWRVDEVNAPPSLAVFKGTIWSFTVEPKALPIAGSLITATASSSSTAGTGPEKTIDGSGLNADGEHSTNAEDMWLSSGTGPDPAWIQYAFDKPYVLNKALVWNSNQSLESLFGFGCKDVTVEYSLDGVGWASLGDVELVQGPGVPTYTANSTIPLNDVVAQYVKLTIHSNWGGVLPQKGLSEVRFYAVPVSAREPSPAEGTADVAPATTLIWRSGRMAASHEVYLSTDRNAVADGTALVATVSQASYDATLDLGVTYYWSVTEVNAAQTPASWAGDVWSFSTAPFVVVDNFETYTNDSPNRVFQAWIDGAGFSPDDFFPNGHPGNSTGALVGNDPQLGDIMETTIVHSGGQSVPFFYDNAAAATSEMTRTIDASQGNWTKFAVETLTLYFYGDNDNTGGAPLWVKLTDKNNKSATATFSDVSALTDQAWTEWNMPLAGFAGIDLTKIASMTIGIGPGIAAGQLFLDDIRLYPTRDIPVPMTPVLVGHWRLDNNLQDGSGNGNNGTLSGGATYDSAGRIGAALSLDGIDDYVDCGNGASLNITDTITLAAWVKTSDAANAQHNPFVAKGDTSYAIKHNTGDFIEFFVYEGGQWYAAASEDVTADFNGTWHHVAGMYDGTQTKLYIDGKVVGSLLHTGAIAPNTYNVNIGRNSQNTDRLYYGLIDDVRIYHGVLGTSEIVKLANP